MQRLPRPASVRLIETAFRDHPLRTPSRAEEIPRLPRPASVRRIETELRDHPLRSPSSFARCEREADTDRAQGSPPCAPRQVSRHCHPCYALQV